MIQTTKERQLIEVLEGKPCAETFGNDITCSKPCCFVCKYLDTCTEKWREGHIYCPVVRKPRWCSSTKKRYEELFGNGTVEK